MNNINYRGNIFLNIEKAFLQNQDMTVGEILFSFLHKDNLNGKHFFYAKDQEIHQALDNFLKFGIEQDEPLEEQAFEFWAAQKTLIK